MNKNDFKNPLIQSGAVLLFVFLLISIVAGSGSEGLWGSIGALISGLISAVIFVVALCIAIVFSIAVIVGLYIAAVSIYSADKGRDLFDQFKTSLCELYNKIRGSQVAAKITIPKLGKSKPESLVVSKPESKPVAETKPSVEPQPITAPVTGPTDAQLSSLEAKLDNFSTKLAELTQTTSANAEQVAALQQQIDNQADNAGVEDKVAAIEETHQSFNAQLTDISSQLDSNKAAVQKLEQQIVKEHKRITDELSGLHEKTSVPEVVSGILSYIDSPEDRDKITEKAKEGISRGMTYAQIDDFFKDSFSPEIYQELAAHPRLTKDFLRSIKKKF